LVGQITLHSFLVHREGRRVIITVEEEGEAGEGVGEDCQINIPRRQRPSQRLVKYTYILYLVFVLLYIHIYTIIFDISISHIMFRYILELKPIVVAIQWALVRTYWIDELLD